MTSVAIVVHSCSSPSCRHHDRDLQLDKFHPAITVLHEPSYDEASSSGFRLPIAHVPRLGMPAATILFQDRARQLLHDSVYVLANAQGFMTCVSRSASDETLGTCSILVSEMLQPVLRGAGMATFSSSISSA